LSVVVMFVLMGTTTGSWAARIPSIRQQLQVTDAQWGLANIGATAGSLISLTVVMALIVRTGPRPLALIGGPLLLLNAPLLAGSTSSLALVAGLFVQGCATGLLAGPMNAQAVQVERRYGRRIMSSFHACFSLGQLAGGLIGTLAAHLGVRPNLQLAASGLLLGALLLMTFRRLPSDARVIRAVRLPVRQRFTRQLLLLAGIALLASINEGSAAQWSAQYTAGTLTAGAAAGAATYTCYTIAMTISRSTGDRLVNRLGQRLFIRLSELVVAVGFGLTLIIGTPTAAFFGFGLLGLGSGCIIPSVIGLAGNQPGIPAGQGVSVVSFGQWPAMLIGPPLIGAVAGLVGLRDALFLLVGAAALILLLAGWIDQPGLQRTLSTSRSLPDTS
jgi:MFS family permease